MMRTKIRILNYLVFIVAWVWAGLDFLNWNQPRDALILAVVGFCSAVAMRYMYLKDW